MTDTVLVGSGRRVLSMPRQHWEQQLMAVPEHQGSRLAFMSPEHHRIRYFVVEQLVRVGIPLTPDWISQGVGLPVARVDAILEELERHLVFLVRNERGAVSWAFPVTVDPTPHRLSFGTGEQVYAAWAEDAMASPFVQGRLRSEPVSVEINTSCAHCARPIQIQVDQDLQSKVHSPGAEPLIFEPHLDWDTFTEPNIIHKYWRNSLFFWSEEHAREFRAAADHVDGMFLNLEQSAYSTRIVQSGLFAFKWNPYNLICAFLLPVLE